MGGGVEMGKSKGWCGSMLSDSNGVGGLLCGLDRHLVARRSASWRLDLIERLRVISEYFVFFFFNIWLLYQNIGKILFSLAIDLPIAAFIKRSYRSFF